MSKNKIKKHFLVAVGGGSDFYEAVTENKARNLAQQDGAEVLYLRGPLGQMKWYHGAFDNYNLLHKVLPMSAPIRHEYATLLASRLISDVACSQELVDTLDELEKDVRRANLSMDTEERFFVEFGDDFADSLTLEQLRALPREDYRMEPNSYYRVSVDDVAKVSEHMHSVMGLVSGDKTATDETLVESKVKEILLLLNADALIRIGDEVGIGYGDREYDDDYDRFEGKPQFGEVHFDVQSAVMRHWSSLNHRTVTSGDVQETFAFAVGRKRSSDQAVYVEGNFVRQNAQKITL